MIKTRLIVNPHTGDLDLILDRDEIDGRLINLENVPHAEEVFEDISGETSGTITTYTGMTISQDDFEGEEYNALACELNAEGRPNRSKLLVDASENRIYANIDLNGDYTLTGTPTAVSYCLVYVLRGLNEYWHEVPIEILCGRPDYSIWTDDGTSLKSIEQRNINLQDKGLLNTDYIDFNIETVASEIAGRMKWDKDCYTLSIVTGLGPVLQVGQEQYILVWNNTGSIIEDGKAVHPNGTATSGVANVEYAIADSHEGIDRAIWVTTMEIPIGSIGIATTFGRVRNADTSAFNVGDNVWVSATVAGDLTNVKPEFPNYPIQVGGIPVVSATVGEIIVSVKGDANDTINNFWNGVIRETFDFRITSDGTTITGALSPSNGHPDLTMMFSDGFTTLTATPDATIELIAGTNTIPQRNFVYIPFSTKVLTVSTSDWPSEQHIRIADVVLRTATSTATNGALKNQNINDAIENTSSFQGHLSHIGQRIRAFQAEWDTGCETSLTVANTPDDVWVSNTAGQVFQMHLQTFTAKDMATGDDIHIVNDPVDAYRITDNLNTLTDDANGDTLNNRWFSIVVWGVNNKTGETSHLMCNLPSGSYTSEDDAVEDSNGYSNYTIPKMFKGTGFLMARFTMRKSSTNFTYNSGVGYQSLLGFYPNSTAGSGSGSSGVTTFTGLTDTPSAYTDQAYNFAKVNSAETALEFIPYEDFVTGTTNQINVADDGDGTVTLSTPQDLDTAADFQVGSLNVTGNTILGDASGDTVISNANNWTFPNLTLINLTTSATALSIDNLLLFDTSNSIVDVNGTLTASNLTGTNTGDQTITLTGNVVGSGTGSITTTVLPDSHLHTDSTIADALTISGGSVNSSPVGNSSASTGSFTTLQATSSLTLIPTNGVFTMTDGLIKLNGAGDLDDLNGIQLFSNTDYKIGFDNQGGSRGLIRYNVDATGSSIHGHIFSGGDLSAGTETDLFYVRTDGHTYANEMAIGTTGFDSTIPPTNGLYVEGNIKTATTLEALTVSATNVATTSNVEAAGQLITNDLNLTPATSSTYGLRFATSGGTDYLTMGVESSLGSYIQSWQSGTLYLNAQGNAVNVGGALTANSTFAVNGNTTLGDAVSDTVVSNAGDWSFANSTTMGIASSSTALNIGSNLMVFDSTNSRVAINRFGANHPLQVYGAVKFGGNSATNQYGALAFGDDNSTTLYNGIFRGTTAGAMDGANVIHLAGYDGVGISCNTAQFGSKGTPTWFMDGSGQVGVQTINPQMDWQLMDTNAGFYGGTAYTNNIPAFITADYDDDWGVVGSTEHWANLFLSNEADPATGGDMGGAIGFGHRNSFGGYHTMMARMGTRYDGNFASSFILQTMHGLNDGQLRTDLTVRNGYLGIGTGVYSTTGVATPATMLELEEVRPGITAADAYCATVTLDPSYEASDAINWTISRHNYMDIQNVSATNSGTGSYTITDATVMRFDASAGTHKAVDSATTKTTPATVDAWIKVNINGTIYYVPSYTSKTS